MDELEIFKALSNKTRLEILTWLKNPELYFNEYKTGVTECGMGVCVGLIQKKSGLTQSTISEYLTVLQKAGLVTAKRSGQWTYYKRNEETILALSKIISSKL
jgi:DNA-binding transcriptional ArsR family regulator